MSNMAASTDLPDGLLVSFYGDDFTGSTSVMEALTFAGLPTVLFLDTPTAEQRARFAGYRGIGIAGIARSQSPDWMTAHLPQVFDTMAALNAPIAHYKVCSTFDSAPRVGSIGRAIDLAAPLLGGEWHPLIVADPAIGRYQVFGNLFAVADGVGYRLDRHPTMSCHPVTPMSEADVRRHLQQQTDKSIGLVDYLALKRGEAGTRLKEERDRGAEIVAIDVADGETLAAAGRLVWENRGDRIFAIGSQGLENALVAHWQATGLLDKPRHEFRSAPVERIVCVSGSCSPVTAGQIAFAEQNGFAGIRLDASRAVDRREWERELGRTEDQALAAVGAGSDPLVFTANGPDDPALACVASAVEASGQSAGEINDRIGSGLGRLLGRVTRHARLTRAVIAGGDTSGHAARELGIYALTATAPIAPGSPLCRAYSDDPAHAQLEIALKGGQIGAPDFFCAVRQGGARPQH
ncbi:four-carbon acid sugar kinase family protein [Microvirga calopogonii]|uniref:four-carbon acid sugar kinase family protein n=1 Tax=Microvirga calopogonii TaxID=2078013 RepID=UPI000E0DC67E|nr:four-carbon acid sugar kinase family protein [Microvirga calopogonii]